MKSQCPSGRSPRSEVFIGSTPSIMDTLARLNADLSQLFPPGIGIVLRQSPFPRVNLLLCFLALVSGLICLIAALRYQPKKSVASVEEEDREQTKQRKLREFREKRKLEKALKRKQAETPLQLHTDLTAPVTLQPVVEAPVLPPQTVPVLPPMTVPVLPPQTVLGPEPIGPVLVMVEETKEERPATVLKPGAGKKPVVTEETKVTQVPVKSKKKLQKGVKVEEGEKVQALAQPVPVKVHEEEQWQQITSRKAKRSTRK